MEEDILEEADDEKRDITEGEERLVMKRGTGEAATTGDDITEEVDDDDGVILRQRDEDTIGLNSGQVTNKLLELISSRKIKVTQHKKL